MGESPVKEIYLHESLRLPLTITIILKEENKK